MWDDGQHRIDSILKESTEPDLNRPASFVPVLSALATPPASGLNRHSIAHVFATGMIDFRFHTEVHIDLGNLVHLQAERYEVVLVDSRDNYYRLPGSGWQQQSVYALVKIDDGMLSLRLVQGPGEVYKGVLIRMPVVSITTEEALQRRPISNGIAASSSTLSIDTDRSW
ncbi:hypothetical protein ADIS_0861 [Lunatimonas lonarensis]|uniref:Uncharacterized protein n=2 Tax=Lunatimonas lonarensis TaxID=1232681 RepID=R7ZX86_9BACT|nr:hypothetical protein ADIS_0861 [Lunatimonas lonarensis]